MTAIITAVKGLLFCWVFVAFCVGQAALLDILFRAVPAICK